MRYPETRGKADSTKYTIAQGTLHIEIANDVNTDVKKVDAELTGTNVVR